MHFGRVAAFSARYNANGCGRCGQRLQVNRMFCDADASGIFMSSLSLVVLVHYFRAINAVDKELHGIAMLCF